MAQGTNGNDTLYNFNTGASLDAGAGNDFVQNQSARSTIFGGAGNDTLNNTSGGSNSVLDGGDGNDTLNNWASGTTLYGGAGDDYIYNDAAASLSVIDAGAGNDTIRANADSTIVSLGSGNDSIGLWGENVSINTGAGNDTISNSASRSVISLGGGGNTVRTYVDSKFIVYGGDEDSELRFDVLNGSNIETTIHSGAGNDILYGTKNADLYIFDPDGGNDVIYNIGGEDTISINGTLDESYDLSSDDVAIRFGNSSVKIKNGVGKTLTIVDNNGAHQKVVGDHLTSQREVIEKFMAALDQSTLKGTAALDEAVKACSSFASTDELISQMISDCRNAGDAETFLRDKCGIILDNEDTGAISGWDAGGSTVKNKENIMPENGSAYSFSGTSFTKNGLTLTLPSQSSLTSTQKTIINSLYSWWVEEGLDLIAESYGSNYGFDSNSSATVKEMDVVFKSLGTGTLAQVTHSYYTSGSNAGKASKLTLSINTNYYSTITDSINGEASDETAGYLDRTLAHEFTHAVMAANIYYFSELPGYIKEGMAELTHGIDDNRKDAIKALASSPSNLAKVLVASTNTVSISGINAPSYSGGYMFLRYLAKQAALESGVAFNGSSADERVSLSGEGNVIRLENGSGNDTVVGFASNDTLSIADDSNYSTLASGSDLIVSIDGGSITLVDAIDQSINVSGGNFVSSVNTIDNRNNNVKVSGTSSAEWIVNSGSKVTIQGNEGADTIVGSDNAELILVASNHGNDLVQNFGKNDTLRCTAGSINATAKSGSNVIVTLKGSAYQSVVTLGGAAALNLKKSGNYIYGSSVNTIDNRTRNTIVSGSSGADSIYNYAKNVTINALEGNDTIQTFGNAVSVFGGNGNDSIKTTGGANVTLHGGNGNDTLIGSSSAEVFQYRSDGGADVITNFGTNDTLHIAAGKLNSYYSSGSDLIVHAKGTSYSGYVTLKGAASNAVKVKVGSGSIQTINNFNTIDNRTRNTIISGSSGNDSIYNYAKNVTINAAAGNDTIQTYGNKVSVFGGNGNDSIKTTGGSGVTLHGGNGNDTLTGSSSAEVFQFRSDGGNDVVTNFGTNDTLRITAGSIQNYYASGADYVVNVKGTSYSGTITLKNVVDVGSIKQSGNTIRLNASSAQLPSEEYWFEQIDQTEDELNSILSTEDNSITFEIDPIDRIKASSIELVGERPLKVRAFTSKKD